MTWNRYYHGDGEARPETRLDPAPPWRRPDLDSPPRYFKPPEGLIEAVNAALHLRRPLLIFGHTGWGKSSVIEQVAHELGLGAVLRWHITSRSTLSEALYRYDALGRIHAQNLNPARAFPAARNHRTGELQRAALRNAGGRRDGAHRVDDIEPFIRLGPLGTALVPSDRPRALLIDEIDKGDLDLPSDLLDVLERGEFEIPELSRHRREQVSIRLWGDDVDKATITKGRVSCQEFPFIVMTSNNDRDFSPAFLRRCIRYEMLRVPEGQLAEVVRGHLQGISENPTDTDKLIGKFTAELKAGRQLALDQLLSAAFVISGESPPTEGERDRLVRLLLRSLSHV